MENEQHHYELRSRSRSRSHTPMILSPPLPEPEVAEHHYDLRSRSRERSHTPGEVTSSRRSGSRSLTGSSNKMHEKNMETIDESKEGSVTESLTDTQSTKSESSTTMTTKRPERRSERQRAKRQIFVNGQSESKEDVTNQKAERKRKSVTPHRILSNDYSSSEEGERKDTSGRSVYEIYKQAGEWWNVFPKTDYTYSKASRCRYEIAPGILAMPNMSRRSIRANGNDNNTIPQNIQPSSSQMSRGATESGISDIDTTDTSSLFRTPVDNYNTQRAQMYSTAKTMVYKRMHVEQHTSQTKMVYSDDEYPVDEWLRYPYSGGPVTYAERYGLSQHESDNELNETFETLQLKTNQRWRIVQWFTYFVHFIVFLVVAPFKKIVEFFKLRKQTTERRMEYHDTTVQLSDNATKRRTMLQFLDHWSNSLYFLYVRVLILDDCLLSRLTRVRERLPERKHSRILLITVLPLLLVLGGWYAARHLFPDVKTALHDMNQGLPYIYWNNNEIENVEQKVTEQAWYKDDLLRRIEALEKERTYRMEYLMNITQLLEERKQNDIEFKNEYNDKLANVENKLDDNELKNTVFTELKIIKHEFEKLHELYSELKSCCKSNAEAFTEQTIEKHVEKILSSYFPGISKSDLMKINQKLLALQNKEDQGVFNNDVGNIEALDERMRKIVKDILRVYDADKTNQVDYALESAGGQIINTRCTQRYDIKSKAFSLFGFTLYYESNNPRTVIQRNPIQPGACWAFQDFPGYLVIQLRCFIYVTGFTLEHVPRSILPNENMSSAPKKFNVWGLRNETDPEPLILGEYEFVISDDSLQYFPVQNTEINRPFEYVELRIHSNHGQLDYTCLYRFRVHGRPA
ncbi:uncharacterized protein LOC105288045 isoform X2 [Ooceraea biroi]|uniref:uncharacterized protein LOC105288045 isoform X2 n=1 Tax=Ooceraea biroi TaxID=2015173 RepID=UPI0005B77C19|nr:uncharacterized protein LOC105288045 isoform X2 [Ooceraea biroi]